MGTKMSKKASCEIVDFDIAIVEALHDLLLDECQYPLDHIALRNSRALTKRMNHALDTKMIEKIAWHGDDHFEMKAGFRGAELSVELWVTDSEGSAYRYGVYVGKEKRKVTEGLHNGDIMTAMRLCELAARAEV